MGDKAAALCNDRCGRSFIIRLYESIGCDSFGKTFVENLWSAFKEIHERERSAGLRRRVVPILPNRHRLPLTTWRVVSDNQLPFWRLAGALQTLGERVYCQTP